MEYFFAVGILFVFLTLLWGISVVKKDVSIVDIVWSLGIFFVPAFLFFSNGSTNLFQTTVLTLVGVWAVRLSIYLFIRNYNKPEDKRYTSIRNNDRAFVVTSLLKIFWLQGGLMCLVSLGLSFMMKNTDVIFYPIQGFFFLTAIFGLLYEAIADWQLFRFKNNPQNKGKVLMSGLWGTTRHPNYFGEFLFWWSIYFLTLPSGWYFSWISPILVSFLLLKVSGVTLTEKQMEEKKDFAAYQNRIPQFFPIFFKKK